ncbi:hypothetical protein DPMN_123781 [Dreissena polymorpha]|uniref:Uncharacterized protein n=1 Tax=Dreissena polymorpha TaxID=45954 RepID=A0A9D4GS96_DREPO|nr:hypothetical protein DPMN_123781 [Dreissena polymorpha]
MERLLFESFMDMQQNASEFNSTTLMKLVSIASRKTLEDALNDQSLMDCIDQYIRFEESVRTGVLGKTAKFWLSVVDHSRLVMMLLYSVKTNSLMLFHECRGQMAELFFAFDGPNYSSRVFTSLLNVI